MELIRYYIQRLIIATSPKIEKPKLWSNLHLKKTTKSKKTFNGKVQIEFVAITNKVC